MLEYIGKKMEMAEWYYFSSGKHYLPAILNNHQHKKITITTKLRKIYITQGKS